MLSSSMAFAQVDFGGSYGASLGADLTGGAMMGSALNAGRGGRNPPGPVLGAAGEEGLRERLRGRYAPSRTGPVAAVETRYSPDPAVSLRVRRQFLGFIAQRSGRAAADALAQAFARNDPLRAWQSQVASDGMRLGDVADAMAEYWAMNWMMANNVPNTSRTQVQAARRQVLSMLRAKADFAGLAEAQRQEMAEGLIYNTLVQGEAFRTFLAKGDGAAVQRLSDAAVNRFRNGAHLDLLAVVLTERGFVRRG